MIYAVFKQQPPANDRIVIEPVGTVQAASGPAAIRAAYDMPEFRSMKRTKMSDFPIVQRVYN